MRFSFYLKYMLGMGFRPQPTIDDTLITIYNGSQAQNDTVSSLRNYRIRKKIADNGFKSEIIDCFIVEYLTQYDPTNLQECSPTEPASNLQASRSCQLSWNDIVASDSIEDYYVYSASFSSVFLFHSSSLF